MITLICGVSRAGKTTYAEEFENVIHLDLMGVTPERYINVIKHLPKDGDVVVEGVYNLKEYRTALIDAYKGKGKRCIWLNTPEVIVRERMIRDGYPISKRHFYFEPPTYSEGWDEIIIIGESNG